MGEAYAETTPGHSNNPPPDSSNGLDTPLSIGANTTVTLQPGETLVIYHPHSRCPMRIVPTAELHSTSERAIRHDIKKPEDSYAPFPTRADFEQAELFVNNNCSDKLVNSQLKFGRQNGMNLEVKTARKMHELLARGFGGDTDNSRAGPIQSTVKTSLPYGFLYSSVGRRSRFHTSKASSRRIGHTKFATVPLCTKSSV